MDRQQADAVVEAISTLITARGDAMRDAQDRLRFALQDPHDPGNRERSLMVRDFNAGAEARSHEIAFARCVGPLQRLGWRWWSMELSRLGLVERPSAPYLRPTDVRWHFVAQCLDDDKTPTSALSLHSHWDDDRRLALGEMAKRRGASSKRRAAGLVGLDEIVRMVGLDEIVRTMSWQGISFADALTVPLTVRNETGEDSTVRAVVVGDRGGDPE